MLKTYIPGLMVLFFTLVSCGGGENDEKNADENQKPAVNNQATTIPSSGIKIAFVYMDTINLNYKMIPIIEEELAQKEKEIQAKLDALQRRALQWEKDWQAKGGPMSSEQEKYMREGQEWQAKLGQAQQGAQMELAQIQTQRMTQANQRMAYIMQEYANEKGYDFIISYQLGGQVYAVNNAYNVTADILQRLNADVDANAANDSLGQ
ncbi:MAG: OmpH family outer membrane protein [Crocinitomicaceae bacterium]|nr:OmpH family outer membrane protein [Crocinitomicaceae bacterium]